MTDYTKGKIYKIFSGELVYIGSTIQTLNERLSCNKSQFKRNVLRGSITKLMETENYKIELLELYSCNSKQELLLREREWIEKTECVNKTMPISSPEEQRQKKIDRYKNDEEHRNKILQKNREWEATHDRKEYTKLKMRRLREKWKNKE
jgi:hypothetical protein